MMGCAVALVLLMDVSGSVSPERYELQREGSAHAFSRPEVARLITPAAPLAVTVVQWAEVPVVALPRRVLRGAADVAALDRDLSSTPRLANGATGLGWALRDGVDAFASAPCEADRKVIDVSGDGDNNFGLSPAEAKEAAEKMGVTINGLPIVVPSPDGPDLEDHYRTTVVTPNGFVVRAKGFDDVERAMAHKLAAEIAGVRPSWDVASATGW